MNRTKDRPRKTYQSRDEIEKDLFVKDEESTRGKAEKSKALDEEMLRRIQQLFCAN
jgi:hypothetical protein